MLTRLLILWLLSEASLHGYRIKKILDDEGLRFWFPVEYGSIYAVLRTLAQGGYVKAVSVEREGQRPERTRYSITPAGRRHFRDLLRKAWRRLPTPADPVQLALAARAELDEEEVVSLLIERRVALEERLVQLDALARAAPAEEMVERQRALTRAELRWVDSLGDRNNERERSSEMPADYPDTQLIANLVITDGTGRVLFVRHDPEEERWWLPGDDLEPYQHPDERARQLLEELSGLEWREPAMIRVDSFRGRRGWHVFFHYLVEAGGEPKADFEVAWFPLDDLPKTVHGSWEKNVVRSVLARETQPHGPSGIPVTGKSGAA